MIWSSRYDHLLTDCASNAEKYKDGSSDTQNEWSEVFTKS